MTHSLTFDGSEVASVTASGRDVRIRLSAARVLRSESADANRLVEGFARGVELLMAGTSLDEAEGHFIGSISQGRVAISGAWSSVIALPSLHAGPVTLELVFANQSSLTLAASGIECRYDGEPNFSESLFC
jgi:hypothetical protein